MTANPQICFLEDNDDLRVVMVGLIESRLQVSCCGLSSFDEMKEAGAEVLNCKIAILDIDLGFRKPSGLDAYLWLQEQNYQGHVFFLTGHGQSDPLVKKATLLGAAVWEKPIGSREMLQQIGMLLSPDQKNKAQAHAELRP